MDGGTHIWYCIACLAHSVVGWALMMWLEAMRVQHWACGLYDCSFQNSNIGKFASRQTQLRLADEKLCVLCCASSRRIQHGLPNKHSVFQIVSKLCATDVAKVCQIFVQQQLRKTNGETSSRNCHKQERKDGKAKWVKFSRDFPEQRASRPRLTDGLNVRIWDTSEYLPSTSCAYAAIHSLGARMTSD